MPDRPPSKYLKQVLGTTQEGRRVRLTLSCGHSKLHNPRVSIPTRAQCQECEA